MHLNILFFFILTLLTFIQGAFAYDLETDLILRPALVYIGTMAVIVLVDRIAGTVKPISTDIRTHNPAEPPVYFNTNLTAQPTNDLTVPPCTDLIVRPTTDLIIYSSPQDIILQSLACNIPPSTDLVFFPPTTKPDFTGNILNSIIWVAVFVSLLGFSYAVIILATRFVLSVNNVQTIEKSGQEIKDNRTNQGIAASTTIATKKKMAKNSHDKIAEDLITEEEEEKKRETQKKQKKQDKDKSKKNKQKRIRKAKNKAAKELAANK